MKRLLRIVQYPLELRGDTFRLMLFSLTAQLLTVGLAPVLSRLYRPEDFGILGVYGSLISLLSCISCMRYENALPLETDQNRARHLVYLCLVILSSEVALLCLLLKFWPATTLAVVKSGSLLGYHPLVPLGLFFASLYLVLEMLCIRDQRYQVLGVGKLAQVLVALSVQLYGAKALETPWGLLLGQTAGFATSSILLALAAVSGQPKLRWPVLMSVATNYRRFALYTTWGNLLASAALQTPFLLLCTAYGPAVGGWLSISNRLVGLPGLLVAESLSRVFMGKSGKLWQENPVKLSHLFRRTLMAQAAVGTVFTLSVFLLAPVAFTTLLGSGWEEAGYYSQLLAASAGAGFVVMPFEHLVDVTGNQRISMLRDASRACLHIGATTAAIAWGLPAASAVAALGWAGVAYSVCSLATTFYCLSGRSR